MNDELPNYTELKNLTEAERSIIIIGYLRTLIVNQSNHLRHHWAVTIVAISAGLIGLVNLTVAMAIIFLRIPK